MDSGTTFLLGPYSTNIRDVLSDDFCKTLLSKYTNISPADHFLGLRETIRYLFLALNCEGELFFVGNKQLDMYWHELMLETDLYSEVCNKLCPNGFLRHSSISYEDHCKERSKESIYSEHLSWLASYHLNFGQIELQAIKFLPLATAIMERMDLNLQGLNDFAQNLVKKVAIQESEASFSFETLLSEIKYNSNEVDDNFIRLRSAVARTIEGLAKNNLKLNGEGSLITPEQLFLSFSASTAFGFTLAQHASAVERLSSASEWKENNDETWKGIMNGVIKVGLATTHLAKPGGTPLKAKETPSGWLLEGLVGWCTGYLIFDYFIVSFDTGDEIVTTLISLPNPFEDPSKTKATVEALDLSVLRATSTVSIKFAGYEVKRHQIVSKRIKGSPIRAPYTQYRMPDLGMSSRIIELLRCDDSNVRRSLAKSHLQELVNEFNELNRIRLTPEVLIDDTIDFRKGELLRKLTRLFVLIEGGNSIKHSNLGPRLMQESFLFDIVVQNPSLIDLKIKRTCTT